MHTPRHKELMSIKETLLQMYPEDGYTLPILFAARKLGYSISTQQVHNLFHKGNGRNKAQIMAAAKHATENVLFSNE